MNELITTNDIYSEYFQNQLSVQAIDRILTVRQQLQLVGYAMIPLVVLFKIGGVSICLMIGTYMANVKIGIQAMYSTVLRAEYIHIFPSLALIVWFSLVQTEYSLEDIQNFAPLSILNLFDTSTLEAWEKYILGNINLTQVVYIIILAYFFSKETNKQFKEALRIVITSYVPAVLIWTASVTFLIVNFS